MLKAALTLALVLIPYDPDAACTVIDSDSSSFEIAATLMQGPDEKSLCPVAYYSRKMSSAKRNYTTHEQELLAPNLTGRLARWMEVFTDYHVVAIEHVPGKLNVVADAMSQCPDFAHLELLFSVTPILAAELGDIATPTSGSASG
eukprot:3150002-Rhodomonas_salina.1